MRAFDGSGTIALDGPLATPRFARLPVRLPRFDIDRLHDLDLAVDLGDRIGSAGWWRGLATLTALSAATWMLGTSGGALPGRIVEPLLPTQQGLADAGEIAPLRMGGATGMAVPPSGKVRRLAEAPERPRIEVSARFGGNIETALRRAGVAGPEAIEAARLIRDASTLKEMRTGTEFDVVLGRRAAKTDPRPLESVSLRAALDLKLDIARNGDGTLRLIRTPIAVDNTPLRVEARVGASLYRSARAAGLPSGVVAEAIRALGYSIDIQRDVRADDRFDMIVAHRRAETGETEMGQLLYAAVDGKKDAAVVRWSGGGKSQFFLPDGSSARKGLMKTPVAGAQLTSGFGFRRHPILGFSRLHQGVDFGAPHGAPVMAAAGGTVVYAGWHGGHGNYVKIRHSKGLETAYAHLSRIKVRVGQRVDQGQNIGAVGSTGLSTGPHLHYEVWSNGRAVNPRGAKFSGGLQLTGGELSRFKSELNRLRSVKPTTGA
jgi:murein DD-endopeptidase MepM/ murein hydrolase activator NlpD